MDHFSVTEQEIRAGILDESSPEQSSICYIRLIENANDMLTHPHSSWFVDKQDGDVNEEAQTCLKTLKDDKLPEKLSPLNFIMLSVRWTGEQGMSEATHRQYLDKFGGMLYDKILSMIDAAVERQGAINDDWLFTEVLQHSLMCAQRCEVFKGRSEILELVKQRLARQKTRKLTRKISVIGERQPWVVYGESGSGKTSLMAKCASHIHEWCEAASPVVVVRFLGES